MPTPDVTPLNASLLSDSPLAPGINESRTGSTWIPFVLYLQDQAPVNLTKRRQTICYLEKKALRLEKDLRASSTIRVMGPIAFRPAQGQKTANFTINGFYARSAGTNAQPVNKTAIIHSGTDIGEKTSLLRYYGNNNTQSVNTPSDALWTEVDTFLDAIDTATTEISRANIYALHYNGVKFGRGYIGFPQ